MEPPSQITPGLAPGDVIAGKFRLERVIGRGGMGSVWAARHVQLEMPVALKFIEAEGDPQDARLRFEREARAAGQIRSPHVVQIIDHGIDGDRPYIAMELLEGEDLGQRLRREGRISVPACARILTQAAKALRRAHDAGIIHRDLKPGNVFLARFDDDEVVKVLDFGVAKMRRAGAIEEPLATQTGIVFGSPSYMSPEQARGARTIDHRSDLWSMAVIVFRAVTGVKPFVGPSIADLVIKLCIDPLPVATRMARDLPPEIDAFFARAFARDPDQRFATAPEMAAAFERVAAAASGAPAGYPHLPGPSIAQPDPMPASSVTATPPSGSGAQVGFAPGTLTPPPAPAGAPFQAPVYARVPDGGMPPIPPATGVPVEPTPGSGVASSPSGGWGAAVTPPPGSQPRAVAPPLAPQGVSFGPTAPALPVAPGAQLPPSLPAVPAPAPGLAPPRAAARPEWLTPAILAVAFGAGLIVVLLLPGMMRSRSPATAASEVPSPVHSTTASAEAVVPPAPAPAETATAAEAAEPPPSVATGGDPPPRATDSPAAAPPASSTGAHPADPGPAPGPTPRTPTRSGKKKRPNFGY